MERPKKAACWQQQQQQQQQQCSFSHSCNNLL
jgi:hypothetical protein